jgi:hypothetical protein
MAGRNTKYWVTATASGIFFRYGLSKKGVPSLHVPARYNQRCVLSPTLFTSAVSILKIEQITTPDKDQQRYRPSLNKNQTEERLLAHGLQGCHNHGHDCLGGCRKTPSAVRQAYGPEQRRSIEGLRYPKPLVIAAYIYVHLIPRDLSALRLDSPPFGRVPGFVPQQRLRDGHFSSASKKPAFRAQP